MDNICAWCNSEIPASESAGFSNQHIISHGICGSCLNELLLNKGVKLRTYLNWLEAPIAVVDSDGRVDMANKSALNMLKRPLEDIEGHLGGEVFECKYASLPEGCGQTLHCSGCAIRLAIEETFETGKSLHRVPAMLKRESKEQQSGDIHFLISTEKAQDVVLLRIDQLKPAKEKRE